MQSIAGTSLDASRAAHYPYACIINIKWNPAGAYVDESAYSMSFPEIILESVKSSRPAASIGATATARASITLANTNGRFTPWNNGSGIYAYIQDGKWRGADVQIRAGYTIPGYYDAEEPPVWQPAVTETVVVFTGMIDELSVAIGQQTVTLACRDYSARLSEYQIRTPLYESQRMDALATLMLARVPASIRPTLTADVAYSQARYGWANDDNLWALLGAMAEAEGGRIYCNYAGALIFENAAHAITGAQASSVATFTIADYANLGAGFSWTDHYNHVEVYYSTPRPGNLREVWKAGEVHKLKAGETKVVKATFDAPVTGLLQPVRMRDYIATTMGGSPDSTTAPVVTATAIAYAQQADITVVNAGSVEMQLVKLALRAKSIVYGADDKVELWIDDTGAESTTPTTTVPRAGWHTLTIRDNRFIQTRAQASSICQFAARRMWRPRMAMQVVDLDAMPWLEVGDCCHITERAGAFDKDCIVQRITYPRGSPRMNLDVIPVKDLYQYAGYYFILGTNTLGESSSTPGKLGI